MTKCLANLIAILNYIIFTTYIYKMILIIITTTTSKYLNMLLKIHKRNIHLNDLYNK